jgi:hypothetical protein
LTSYIKDNNIAESKKETLLSRFMDRGSGVVPRSVLVNKEAMPTENKDQ